jgi:hypothetical protein
VGASQLRRLLIRMPERIILSVDAGATHCRLQFFAFRQDQLEALSPPTKFSWDFTSLAGCEEFRNAAVDTQLGSSEQRAGQQQIEQLSEHITGQWAGLRSSQFSCILAWPGIKNAAADSVIRCANGPRIMLLTQRLKAHLDERLNPKADCIVYPLVSDGTMAGWGEWSHPQGGFFQMDNGYLMMAGTGLAEAFLVDGQLLGRLDLGLPGAFDLHRGDRSYEQCLNGRAWSEDSAQELEDSLIDWLALRRQHFVDRQLDTPQRLVLGGRASQHRLNPSTLENLKAQGWEAAFSQLQDPALWGAAYYVAKTS